MKWRDLDLMERSPSLLGGGQGPHKAGGADRWSPQARRGRAPHQNTSWTISAHRHHHHHFPITLSQDSHQPWVSLPVPAPWGETPLGALP